MNKPIDRISESQTAELPAHAQLVLALAHVNLTASDLQRAERIVAKEEVDWGLFIVSASSHRILPLLGRHVYVHRFGRPSSGLPVFPHPAIYTAAYLHNRSRNLALTDECSLIVRDLQAARVPFAIRKGFTVAQTEYGDSALRRMNDLDFLIPRENMTEAHSVLASAGYAQGTLDTSGSRVEPFDRATQLYWKINLRNQLPYRKPARRLELSEYNVDICHDIFQKSSGLSLSAETLLRRSVAAEVCGVTSNVLRRSDKLLDLCAHLHKEAISLHFIGSKNDLQLSKFLDIALVAAANSKSDWKEFLESVRIEKAEEIVYYALHFTNVLYPDNIPGAILRDLAPSSLDYLDHYGDWDGSPGEWGQQFLTRLFDPARGDGSPESTVPGG